MRQKIECSLNDSCPSAREEQNDPVPPYRQCGRVLRQARCASRGVSTAWDPGGSTGRAPREPRAASWGGSDVRAPAGNSLAVWGVRDVSGTSLFVRPGGGCQAPDSPAPSGGPRFSPLRGGSLWPGRLCSAFSWAGQRRESSASPFGPWHGQLQPAPGLRRGVLLLLPDCGHWGCFVLGPGSPRRCSR